MKIVLLAGRWDIFYLCKKKKKKRNKIFKYEKPFIKYAKLIFIFAILVSCIIIVRGFVLVNVANMQNLYSKMQKDFQMRETFHQKREIDFQIWDILFQKCKTFCVLCEK